jgi:hypothetical protein
MSDEDDQTHHNRRYGSIEIILGPMFSGKSTELLRRIRRYTIAKKRCLVIKHETDIRYSKARMATHDKYVVAIVVVVVVQLCIFASMRCAPRIGLIRHTSNLTHLCHFVTCRQMWDSVPVSKLSDLPQAMVDEHEVIGVDEGQFFPDVVEWCEKQANRHGKHVIVAGREHVRSYCLLRLIERSCSLSCVSPALDGSFQRKQFGRILEVTCGLFLFFVSKWRANSFHVCGSSSVDSVL